MSPILIPCRDMDMKLKYNVLTSSMKFSRCTKSTTPLVISVYHIDCCCYLDDICVNVGDLIDLVCYSVDVDTAGVRQLTKVTVPNKCNQKSNCCCLFVVLTKQIRCVRAQHQVLQTHKTF